MAIDLDNITSGYNVSKINANFQKVEDYINDKLLTRAETGVAGEAMMERDLDMNGFRILNADIETSDITNDRAIRVPVGEGPIDPLPNADARKGKVLSFDINTGLPIVTAPASGSAVDVLNQLASYADGVGDALVGVKQPLTGSVGRSQHFKNLDIVSVKDFGAVGDGVANDSAAVQAAINAYSSVNYPVRIVFPQGTYNITGITIPRSGIVLDLRGATLSASTGSMFSRVFPQLTQAAFIAAYPALDGDQTYFRPIELIGGTVNLTGTATFLEVRQPFLDKYSVWGKTVIQRDTNIRIYGTSKAFAIHGGWGFDFNNVSVTGDVNALTGFGSSVGSGTLLYMRPDGTNFASSHAQRISFTNCNIEYCTVFDGLKGLCTNSCEALAFTDSACMFVNGGTIQGVNLFHYTRGMFVTTARECVMAGMAGVLIDGTQVQRYNNPRDDQRYGTFAFIGGGGDILVSNVRALAGANLNGSMFSVLAANGEQFINVNFNSIQYNSGGVSNLDEPDVNLQTSVVRLMTGGTGTIAGITLLDITGSNVHNIVDMGDNAAPQSMRRADLKGIRNISTAVKRRVRWIGENIGALHAPELFRQVTFRLRSMANSSGVNEACFTDAFLTTLTGAITATRVTTAGVSNSTGIALREMQEGGLAILDLYQNASLTVGARVEATAQFRFSSADSILS